MTIDLEQYKARLKALNDATVLATFIAEAPTMVQALVEEVERLQAKVDEQWRTIHPQGKHLVTSAVPLNSILQLEADLKRKDEALKAAYSELWDGDKRGRATHILNRALQLAEFERPMNLEQLDAYWNALKEPTP